MDELTTLKNLVRQLLNDLPTKRDWLDPAVELGLRYHTNAVTPASTYRALMQEWAQKEKS